jgi:C-terminal processing protease CtpA/Prc
MVIGGYIGFYYAGGGSNKEFQAANPPSVELPSDENTISSEQAPDVLTEGPSVAVTETNVTDAVRPREDVNRRRPGPAAMSDLDSSDGIQSEDIGLGPARQIFPRGLDPSKTPTANPDLSDSGIKIRDILSGLGITARENANGWAVSSVSANSAAARSGIKAGDVIVAIGDQPLSEITGRTSSFTIRSIRLRRDGRTITIAFN